MRSTRTFENNSNNHNNSNNVNNYKSTIIKIIKLIPARRATPCDAEVQVRQAAQPSERRARADAIQVLQAAQPRERRRQGRRAAGTEGVAPASGRGAGCHSGQGRGVGKEAVCWRQSGGMDVAKRRVFPPSLAPSPSAFPLRQASRPPSATPPHAAR